MSDRFSRAGCPRRHDGACVLVGHDPVLCPDTEQAVTPHDPLGRFVKGSSGNKHTLKTLRGLRRRMREELDGGEELFQAMLVTAGLRTSSGGKGSDDIPPVVKARMQIHLGELLWGKDVKIGIEHLGTVEHEHVVSVAQAPDFSRLTIDERRALHAMRLKLEKRPASEGAVDAVTDDEKKEEE